MCGERLTSFRKSPAQQSSLHGLQNISKHPSVCQRNACTLPNVDPPLCSAHLSSFRLDELGGIQAHSWSCGLVHSSYKAMLDIVWHKHEWLRLRFFIIGMCVMQWHNRQCLILEDDVCQQQRYTGKYYKLFKNYFNSCHKNDSQSPETDNLCQLWEIRTQHKVIFSGSKWSTTSPKPFI